MKMEINLKVENRALQPLINQNVTAEGIGFYSQKKYDDLKRDYEGLDQKYKELEQKYEIETTELKRELIEFKTQAHYWKTQFEQLKSKQNELDAKVEKLVADLKKREQQLFGRKSEKHISKSEQEKSAENKKKRGQQEGSEGHGRREQADLLRIDEEIKLSEDKTCCPCCGLPYEELSLTDDAEVLEINVKAHVRVIKRKKYRRSCTCQENKDPAIITAPAPGKLLPKSKIGTSIWAYLLLSKYKYKQPLNGALEEMENAGLSLAAGTITDGLHK